MEAIWKLLRVLCCLAYQKITQITATEKESLQWEPRGVIKQFLLFYTFFVLKSDYKYVSSGACSVYLHNAVDFPHKEEAGKESHST